MTDRFSKLMFTISLDMIVIKNLWIKQETILEILQDMHHYITFLNYLLQHISLLNNSGQFNWCMLRKQPI